MASQSFGLPPLAMAWEVQMMALYLQANARVKERKTRRKCFMFGVKL